MDVIGGQPGRGPYGVLRREGYMGQVDVSVVVLFVDYHGQHLSHGVVNAPRAAVAVAVGVE